MKLLDELQKRLDAPNDRQLAAKLNLSTPVISRIRTGKNGVSAEIMIHLHELLGMSIAEIKEQLKTMLMQDQAWQREKFGLMMKAIREKARIE